MTAVAVPVGAGSRAVANARDLYNQAKELIDAGHETAQIARQIDNLLVLAKLSAEIGQAEALERIAVVLEERHRG